MFTPKYTLTKTLLSNITQIERLYGQLEAYKIPKKLEINLERDNLIQSSYVSNSIEGNPLTLKDVTNLLLDDRVPVNRDEKEVTNYFSILKNLKNYQEKPLSVEMINDFHNQLMTGVKDAISGQIRNKKVVVGKYLGKDKQAVSLEIKHEPPFHGKDKIEASLKDLFLWQKTETDLPIAIKTGVFHHHFVYIHPYIDGNGRVCRLLTALVFLQNKYWINKYFVLDDYYDIDRHMYSDKLHSADSGDKTEWLEYFSEGIMYSLQAALAKIKNAQSQLQIEDRPTKKEKQVLDIVQERNELTSTDLVEILKISRQQAHNLLKSLVDKGFLNKKGKTKKSYYYLK